MTREILFDAGKAVKSIAADYDFTYMAWLDIFSTLQAVTQRAAKTGTDAPTGIPTL
jgi:hypothetical protein